MKSKTIFVLFSRLIVASLTLLSGAAFADIRIHFGRIPQQEIAIFAQDLKTNEILVAHRPNAAMNPASTMKLVTSFAALDSLGSHFRWHTEWKSTGSIHNNTLWGDLYWQGSGDPVFDQSDLLEMQTQLQQKGIEKINGQLILDGSVWPQIPSAEGFDDDLAETFTTPPNPHMLAYKVVWITPEEQLDGHVDIQTRPPLPNLFKKTNIQLNSSNDDSECQSLKRYLKAAYQHHTLSVNGLIPRSCLNQEMFINMLNHDEMASYSFINSWRSAGHEISSTTALNNLIAPYGITPPQAQTLASHFSLPLSDVIADMNTHSNNIIARSIFLTLGSEKHMPSEAVVRRSLANHHIDDEVFIVENGSGLSRRSRVNAELLGQVLFQAYHSHFAHDFINSLPQAGGEGTLKHRFKHIGQSLRLKTGTLKNVRALAGYWLPDTMHSHPISIVVLINSPNSSIYLDDLDHLVNQLLRSISEQEHHNK